MAFISLTLTTGEKTWVNIDKIVRLEEDKDRTLVVIDSGSIAVLESIDEMFDRIFKIERA